MLEDDGRALCPRTGKVCYNTEREASAAIRKIKRWRGRGRSGTIPKRAYLCRFCGAYHLTHFSKKRHSGMGKPIGIDVPSGTESFMREV